MNTILIVEDEPAMVRGLTDAFEHHGFHVLSASDGERGLELACSSRADAIVLDLMLPRKDGLEVCRELRTRGLRTPILMLTARGAEGDRVTGLEEGADDYVTKPFSVRELIARVMALLRRCASDQDGGTARIGDAVVDFKQYAVFRNGRRHDLTRLEVQLLSFFLAHPHEVFTRERLLNAIWGYDAYPSTRTVDTFVLRLRQKIETDPHHPTHLLTVHGAGYRFMP